LIISIYISSEKISIPFSATMHLFSFQISLMVAYLTAIQAAPVPSFHDVEKAWKEGRTEVRFDDHSNSIPHFF